MQSGLLENRAADHVISRHRIHRVEAHCGEDVPCRHLPAVLVPENPRWRVRVSFSGNFANFLLGLPRFAAVVVEVPVMVAGLVIMMVMSAGEVLVEFAIVSVGSAH